MEKITAEEFRSTALHGRGRSSPFYNELLNLKPGEGRTILKKEWQRSYVPTKMTNRIAKKYGYRFEQGALPDRSGWRVLRVK
jgi:hypothetical protein